MRRGDSCSVLAAGSTSRTLDATPLRMSIFDSSPKVSKTDSALTLEMRPSFFRNLGGVILVSSAVLVALSWADRPLMMCIALFTSMTGLYALAFAGRIARRRTFSFDTVTRTVQRGDGRQTVSFTAVSHLRVRRHFTSNTVLEIVQHGGKVCRVHESGSPEVEEALCNEIVRFTGLRRE